MSIVIELPASTIIGSYVEEYIDLTSPANFHAQAFGVVPPGEVWVVQGATCYSNDCDLYVAGIAKVSGAVYYWISLINPAGTNDAAQINAPVVLFPGERLGFQWGGMTENDNIFSHAVGIKYAIDLGV